MENSFFQYSKEKLEDETKIDNKIKENKNVDKSKNNIEDLYNQYKNLTQDELLLNLKQEVEKQKANGTFNINVLQKSIDEIGAYLTSEQKENIKRLLNQINEN